jgi:MFS family permease
MALLGAAVLGVGLDSEADVGPYLLARYFGRRHFSVLAYAIGGATGPLWIGHLYDRSGSYQPRFIVCLAAVAFAAVMVSLFLRPEVEKTTHEPDVAASAAASLEG